MVVKRTIFAFHWARKTNFFNGMQRNDNNNNNAKWATLFGSESARNQTHSQACGPRAALRLGDQSKLKDNGGLFTLIAIQLGQVSIR